MIAAPALQKHQHPDPTAADGTHFREVQHYEAGIALCRNCVPQLERLVAADKPSFTLDNSHLANLINMYVSHDCLQT